MTHKIKPTNRQQQQQQQQINPALPRAEKKLNEEINKDSINVQQLKKTCDQAQQNNMQTICRSDKQTDETNHTHIHTHDRARARARAHTHTHTYTHTRERARTPPPLL